MVDAEQLKSSVEEGHSVRTLGHVTTIIKLILNIVKTKNTLRQPGIEPGSIAWKATILTTRLLSLIQITEYGIWNSGF